MASYHLENIEDIVITQQQAHLKDERSHCGVNDRVCHLLWKNWKQIKKTIIHPSRLVPFVQMAEVGPLVPEFDICGLEQLREA